MKNKFKEILDEAVETARFVKDVQVGGDAKFPYMSLKEGTLTIDRITWAVGSRLLPLVTSMGVTRFVIPALIGSFTGVTQLAIVIFILINLAQTRFGKPIEVEKDKQTVKEQLVGSDAGVIQYVSDGLWSMLVDYTIARGMGNFIRNHVTHKMSSKQIDDLANQTIQ